MTDGQQIQLSIPSWASSVLLAFVVGTSGLAIGGYSGASVATQEQPAVLAQAIEQQSEDIGDLKAEVRDLRDDLAKAATGSWTRADHLRWEDRAFLGLERRVEQLEADR